jgi:hypothetical protein
MSAAGARGTAALREAGKLLCGGVGLVRRLARGDHAAPLGTSRGTGRSSTTLRPVSPALGGRAEVTAQQPIEHPYRPAELSGLSSQLRSLLVSTRAVRSSAETLRAIASAL